MKKSKLKIIGRYACELSIVVLGVLISLLISSKLSERNERNDLQLQLLAVRLELEDNLRFIDEFIYYYDQVNLTKENINAGKWDDKDAWALSWCQNFYYKRDALDMLKNTGYLRLITDKQQLLDILECYHLMEIAKDDNDRFMAIKISLISFEDDNSIQLSIGRIKRWIIDMDGTEKYFHKSKDQINKVLTYKF